MKIVVKSYWFIFLLFAISCKKNETRTSPDPVTWKLNHDDSIVCNMMDIKDTICFTYTDSNSNYSKLITAIKSQVEDMVSETKAQDIDPVRNDGTIITTYSKKYTYLDNNNNFEVVFKVCPTFDLSGTIRLPSEFKMFFGEKFTYTRPIHANGLPYNATTHDSLVYNNKVYRNCYYNQLALEQNLSLYILNNQGFPLWLENKANRIYLDFLP